MARCTPRIREVMRQNFAPLEFAIIYQVPSRYCYLMIKINISARLFKWPNLRNWLFHSFRHLFITFRVFFWTFKKISLKKADCRCINYKKNDKIYDSSYKLLRYSFVKTYCNMHGIFRPAIGLTPVCILWQILRRSQAVHLGFLEPSPTHHRHWRPNWKNGQNHPRCLSKRTKMPTKLCWITPWCWKIPHMFFLYLLVFCNDDQLLNARDMW